MSAPGQKQTLGILAYDAPPAVESSQLRRRWQVLTVCMFLKQSGATVCLPRDRSAVGSRSYFAMYSDESFSAMSRKACLSCSPS
jgi:hypothetical protein